ncbi:ankyrin repeat domain-containing protein [Candidatus Babeliales bacterium]|nr:ankyrin repeat domain-containing protein [Candidatus Babeliales bacterium]
MTKKYGCFFALVWCLLKLNTPMHAAALSSKLPLTSLEVLQVSQLLLALSDNSREKQFEALKACNKKLLEKIINMPLNNKHNTLLHIICERNNPFKDFKLEEEAAFISFLFSNGSDINAKNVSRSQPLHLACFSGNVAIVEFLVHKGAQRAEIDGAGQTPLEIATQRYNQHKDYKTESDIKRANNFKRIIDYLRPITPVRSVHTPTRQTKVEDEDELFPLDDLE